MFTKMFLSIFLLLGLAFSQIAGFLEGECEFSHRPLRVGSFNIQHLGKSKLSNQTVVDNIIKILNHFDVVLVQEVHDKDLKGMNGLLKQLHTATTNTNWAFKASESLGLSTYKEQYVFFYKSDAAAVTDTYQYPDPKKVYGRPPFSIKLEYCSYYKKRTVALGGVHIRPSEARTELNELDDTMKEIAKHWTGIDGVITMGDFNADCGYLAKKYRTTYPIFTTSGDFRSLIEDGTDTTVKASTCAYDRVIVYGKNVAARRAKVYNFQKVLHLSQESAEAISDHFPVEFMLN